FQRVRTGAPDPQRPVAISSQRPVCSDGPVNVADGIPVLARSISGHRCSSRQSCVPAIPGSKFTHLSPPKNGALVRYLYLQVRTIALPPNRWVKAAAPYLL